jgi:hypothetical protein
VTTFYEAINIDGEFLDPLFTTAPAAAAALARLTAASSGDYSSDEHRS